MAPPKKNQKMSLQTFLGDETLGSWADEMEDLPAVPAASSGYGQRRDYGSGGGTDRGGNDRYSGYSRADDRFPPRTPLAVPDKPPYTAHVGNLSYDVSETEISEFFGDDVLNVRLVRDRVEDRPKGFGYVEFNTKEGLVKALDMAGAQLAGRNIKINVADPPKDRPDDRTTGEWRRSGPLPALEQPQRRGSGYERSHDREEGGGRRGSSYDNESKPSRDFNWERKGPLSPLAPPTPTGSDSGRPRGERDFRRRSPAPSADGGNRERERPHVERQPTAAEKDNEWRRGARPDPPQRTPTSPVAPQTRPKLELKKRSEQPVDASAPTPGSDKPNPFGAARPIDTTQKEREIEERRAAAAAERKAREEKAREEKRLARAAADAEDKKSEAGTPRTKNFDVLRRSSTTASDNGMQAETDDVEAKEKVEKKKTERPVNKSPENWRARGPPKEQQSKEESDGWTVATGPKRGRGQSGAGRAVPAS